jgi:DNA-binding transcriptional ArsR family regulator
MTKTANGDQLQDEMCATYLKAVADPIRLKVIRAFQAGPLNVSDVSELLGEEVGIVLHHLRVLYHARIVTIIPAGKYIYYSLDPQIFQSKKRKGHSMLDFGCCQLCVDADPKD